MHTQVHTAYEYIYLWEAKMSGKDADILLQEQNNEDILFKVLSCSVVQNLYLNIEALKGSL